MELDPHMGEENIKHCFLYMQVIFSPDHKKGSLSSYKFIHAMTGALNRNQFIQDKIFCCAFLSTYNKDGIK